jgi:hypothetical protein
MSDETGKPRPSGRGAVKKIHLDARERDLIRRIIGYVVDSCDERIIVTNRVDRLAVTWLRDEAVALLPHFAEPGGSA